MHRAGASRHHRPTDHGITDTEERKTIMIRPAYMWFGELSDHQRELINAHFNRVTKARELRDSATQIAVNQDQDAEALATVNRELEEMITEIRSLGDQLRASGIGMSRTPWERHQDMGDE
jgi:hypothetical protein